MKMKNENQMDNKTLPTLLETDTNTPKSIISASILACDFAYLADECKEILDYGADWIHVDIMDGHFVPNLTLGAPIVKCLRKHTNAFLDCHLMVSDPEFWIKDFSNAGANSFIFHIEAVSNNQNENINKEKMLKIIKLIKENGMYVGIALKPETPVESVYQYIEYGIDIVLILTVNPGHGGQQFMSDKITKCKLLREKYPKLNISVDGGIKLDTIQIAAKNGVNIFVSGSGIFNVDDRKKRISEFKNIINESSN